MALTIDELNVEIEASAGNVGDSLDKLTNTLTRLGEATKNAAKLQSVAKGISNIASASQSLNTINYPQLGDNINKLAKALGGLNSVKVQIGATVKSLKSITQIAEDLGQDGMLDGLDANIKKLATSLSHLSGVKTSLGSTLGNLSKLAGISNQLESALGGGNLDKNLTKISSSLQGFGAITPGKMTSVINNLGKLRDFSATMDSASIDAMSESLTKISNALVSFGSIEKGGMTSIVNSLGKLPELSKSLEAMDMDKFTNQMNRLAAAMTPLAEKCNQVSAGFSRLPQRTRQVMTVFDNLEGKTKNVTKSFGGLVSGMTKTIAKASVLYFAFSKLAGMVAGWFNKSNDYIESLNLFAVSMGEHYEQAFMYAQKVSGAMGIDTEEWMKFQGVFQSMNKGFGVSSDMAAKMSKNLTQLSYDFASFFNTSTEAAFDKLSSAMAGQVKGLREFGIETTVAALEEYALSKGINKSVSSMNMAEKSLLRYNLIMERSIDIQHDMARTLITPSNSLRILNSQLNQMKRAFGDIFSVIATKLIPYIQAFVKLVTQAANSLARLFGFKLPQIDYSIGGSGGFAADLEDAAGSAGDVAGSLKEARKQMMGFDELNILNNDKNTGGGGSSSGGTGGIGFDMDLADYDFLDGIVSGGLVDKIATAMSEFWAKSQPMRDALVNLWEALVPFAEKVGEGLLRFVKDTIEVAIDFDNNIIAPTINAIADALKDVDPDKVEKLGYSLGQLAQALLLWKGLTWVGTLFSQIGVGFSSLAGGIDLLSGSGGLQGVIAMLAPFVDVLYDTFINLLGEGLGKRFDQALAGFVGGGIIGATIGMLGGPIGMGIGALVGAIVGAFWDEFVNFFKKIFNWQATMEIFQSAIDHFEKAFSSDNFLEIGANVVLGIIEGLLGAIALFLEPIKNLFEYIWDAICGLFGIKSPSREMKPLGKNILLGLVEGFKGAFNSMWEAVSQWGSTTFTKIKEAFSLSSIKGHFQNVLDGIKQVFSSVGSWFGSIFSDAWTKVKNVFSSGGKIFDGIKEGIADTFKTIVNRLISGINTIIATPFNKINSMLNTIRNVSVLGFEPFKKLWSYNPLSIPRIPQFAQGGFPQMGGLFIANESGPEMVGKIGNRTAVANNDQIVQAVSTGVYNAVMAAMGGQSGGNQTVKIVLEVDGDKMSEKVVKWHNNKVFSTGVSPLMV